MNLMGDINEAVRIEKDYDIVILFDFIKKEFPSLLNNLLEKYKTGGADKEYKNILYKTVNELRDKYSLSSSYSKPMKEKLKQDNKKV